MNTQADKHRVLPHHAARFVATVRLPTEWGEFALHGFEAGTTEHLALIRLVRWRVWKRGHGEVA